MDAPSLGGTLNATTDQAAKETRETEQKDHNKTILTHGPTGGYVGAGNDPTFTAPLNASVAPDSSEPPSVDIFSNSEEKAVDTKAPTVLPPLPQAPEPAAQPQAPALPEIPAPTATPTETLADIDRKNRATMHADAQAEVSAAFSDAPAPAAPDVPEVAEPDLPPLQPASPQVPAGMPPLPDFSNMPQPALPPLPQFDPLQPSGAVPPEQLGQIFGSPAPQPTPVPPNQPADPNQFKIPGQN